VAPDAAMLLTAANLSFAYPHKDGDRTVLKDVGLALAGGEVVALLGPNGSGKKHAHSLSARPTRLPPARFRGTGNRSNPGGCAIWRASSRICRNRRPGMPRKPFVPGWRWAARRIGGHSALKVRRTKTIVTDVARHLNLTDLLDRRLDELSGGQRQRVLLGRCLVQQPKAMLLDEPNTFLDLRHQVELSRMLRKLATERGIGILMASHDLKPRRGIR